MTNRRRWKQWSEEHAGQVLDEADRSGLRDPRFARDQGIQPNRIAWWRKRLGRPWVEPGARGKLTFVDAPTHRRGAGRGGYIEREGRQLGGLSGSQRRFGTGVPARRIAGAILLFRIRIGRHVMR